MDRLLITGGRKLEGTLAISGAKNAALPLIAATLLTGDTLELRNVPELADVVSMMRLVQRLGVASTYLPGEPGRVAFHCQELLSTTAPYDLVRKMRASVLVLGPLLARGGEAIVSMPGGCAIGTRPIDLHLSGMERLGAIIELSQGYVTARAPAGGLKGARIELTQPSVGATENLLMAAATAKGTTTIIGAAREPEIVDLALLLSSMGAAIEGAGTSTITIEGVAQLHGAVHSIMPDRIEAGTYVMAAGITGGRLHITGGDLGLLGGAREKLEEAGLQFTDTADGFAVSVASEGLRGTDVMTRPYPGFPTDLQAQFMALMCNAEGASMITETIFENRFMHVPELARMGAQITIHGGSALVRGQGARGTTLRGAPVMATDLRASVSLVLAALAAEGETEINRIYHLDRGYEHLEQKLQAVGACVERIP
ncbi:UDP-N-acetylglucosamine 1-carboxyvinyltransferase [Arboricoccus pini]|uniref:UDP-N-acetylglucosamine 1-carboxyvinyltransferase n=1 Tax=Arboricoccus pini TaxID=1963835 RepID=UPI000B4FF186|nr:UDP-N-acetylglucosamine 1-carboxyvinyltransferase [Arboricoccus pini]